MTVVPQNAMSAPADPLPSPAPATVPTSAGATKPEPGSSEGVLPAGLLGKTGRIRHIAIIMDGNGRWAQQQGRPRIEGHKRGAKSVRAVVRAARELGLQALTLYAFSEQNWERPLDEVQGLMQLLYDYVHEEREEILDNGIRLRTIGNISRLPDFVQVPLQQLVADSAGGHGMTLTLALSYGGREAIVDAVRAVAAAVGAGQLPLSELDESALSRRFQTGELPEVDLIIRTSGERRTSNFLLWESTHAQFLTTAALWPEFGKAELIAALRSLSFVQGASPP